MPSHPHKGRGAISRPEGRFAKRPVQFDAEEVAQRKAVAPETVLTAMRAGKIISHNSSPDIPFDQSINPYQGCEHGCIYCYARPSHSYLDLSPGLDFETRIFYKPNAASRLLEEWEKPGYVCKPITIGANTDPYQPAEKSLGITRQLLEQFAAHGHPVNIITKGTLITRDTDLLASLAARGLCSVAFSLPTMDSALKRIGVAASRLLEEWEKPGYVCKPITIGANTDPYQPAEKSLGITRQLLEQLSRTRLRLFQQAASVLQYCIFIQ